MKAIVEFFANQPGLGFLALVTAEIALIGALGLLAIRLARRDAATRYGIGLTALVLIGLCAPITWLLKQTAWATVTWQRTVTLQPELSTPAGPGQQEPVPLWVWLWIVGMGAILAKLLSGVWRVHRERRRAVLVSHQRGIPVYATSDVGPAVVGAIRPVILMPRGLLDSLKEEEVRDVLAHEFAHVAHRHLLVALFQRLLTCVLWPHPFVHLISRSVATAREEVCDNAVLRSAGAARYARVLLRVAECRQGPRQFSASMGLLGPPTQLEERVRGLLDPNRRIDSTMNKSKFFLACLALALGTVAVAGARIQTHVLVAAAAAQDNGKLVPPKPAKAPKVIKHKVKLAKKASKKKQRGKAPTLLPPAAPGAPGMMPPVQKTPGVKAEPAQPGAPGMPPPARPGGMAPGAPPAKLPPSVPGVAPGGMPPLPPAKADTLPPARGGQAAPPAKKGLRVPILKDIPIVDYGYPEPAEAATLPLVAEPQKGKERIVDIPLVAPKAESKLATPAPAKKIKRAAKLAIVKSKKAN